MSTIAKSLQRKAVWSAILLLAAAVLPARGIDPDLPYSSGSTGVDGPLTFRTIPNGRNSQAIAYDGERQEMVLFGGWNGSYLSDTWAFRNNNWVKLNPAQSPTRRYGHRMVYDSVRKEVVLFGGFVDGIYLNDTWTWNGSTWTQKSPTTSPSIRSYHAMTFDAARSKVLLHGGQGSNGGAETWYWDGTNWANVSPAATPGNQNGHSMVYDAARQKVVLFTSNSRQTWVFDGVNWANVTPGNGAANPEGRDNFQLAYDEARQEVVLYGGSNLTTLWIWNGTTWTQRNSTTGIGFRNYAAMAYHPSLQRVLLFGGQYPGVDEYTADTWSWNGTDWTFISGKVQTFDMTARANGIYNLTTIMVPPLVTVQVKKNAGNTPLRWLASGDVTIDGVLSVNGAFAPNNLEPGVVAQGGPGGYEGGRGALPFSQTSSYVATPGQGPGGGIAGDTLSETGGDGDYAGSAGYGNSFLQPLIGGSGGGGGGSNNNTQGGHGGGGGGAIMIATSRDIILNGKITANGGTSQHSGASWGGRGSGGAVLLRADRISGGGTIEAWGGDSNNPNGRVRLEAFFRLLSAPNPSVPVVASSTPIQGPDQTQVPTLAVTRVAGQNVVPPPSGNQLTPDVVFSQAGQITVDVAANNVPDGTPVRLRITTPTGIINAGPQFLTGGNASFSVIVPAGTGTFQAFADFRTSN